MTGDLPEIVVAELSQNTRDVVRVSLAAFRGTPTVGVWRFYRRLGGNLRPGKGELLWGCATCRCWRRR